MDDKERDRIIKEALSSSEGRGQLAQVMVADLRNRMAERQAQPPCHQI